MSWKLFNLFSYFRNGFEGNLLLFTLSQEVHRVFQGICRETPQKGVMKCKTKNNFVDNFSQGVSYP